MKCLTFVDTHNDQKAIQALVKRAKKADIDVIFCAGDLSNFGRGLHPSLKQLDAIGKPVFIVPSNHEPQEELNEALKEYQNIINVHEKAVQINDYVLLGYGEGGFDQEDKHFRKLARHWYGHYKEQKTILMTHGPPYNTKLDDMGSYGHVGNKDYTAFIKRIKPRLVIAGHIHECAGAIDSIDSTKLVNPGPEGMVINLP